MFNISDKVVCIDDSDQDDHGDSVILNIIYVIRGIRDYEEEDFIGLYLVGLNAGIDEEDGSERTFASERFRKLEDIKEENRLKNSCKSTNKEYIKL